MSQNSRKPGCSAVWLRRLVLPAVMIGVTVAVAAAEEVIVKAHGANIQPRPNGMGAPVAMVSQNDKLTVLARQQSGWLKVRTPGGQEGYVKEGALSAVAFPTGNGEVKGGGGISGLDPNLAGRGQLAGAAQQFASKNNLNPTAVNQAMKRAQSITPDEQDKFEQDGKVGPYKSR
jgi:flagellar basal body rod protein FlgF